MTLSSTKSQNNTVVHSLHQSSWRSLGWCPLSYPVSKAFFSCRPIPPQKKEPLTINPFFPLHQDVLLAAVRELLILDGTIVASSLQVLTERTNDLPTPSKSENTNTHKRKRNEIDDHRTQMKHCMENDSLMEYKAKSSEDLAWETVLQSSWNHVVSSSLKQEDTSSLLHTTHDPHSISLPLQNNTSIVTNHAHRIRKVSDADDGLDHSLSTKQLPHCDGINHMIPMDILLGNNPSAKYILPQYLVILDNIRSGNVCVDKRTVDHAVREIMTQKVDVMENEFKLLLELKSSLPAFLDLSIIMEEYLRKVSFDMVSCLVKNTSDEALREFLGYKSSMLKKQDAVSLIADLLFDVSHALFAWEQTESELYDKHDPSWKNTSCKKIDSHICQMLFDARALRKIGGFEPSSLLCHALSIGRLRSKNESWSEHRKTNEGRNMFAHHDNRTARLTAGLLRRSKKRKMNHFNKSLESLTDVGNARLRSCSLASDTMDVIHETDPSALSGVIKITIRRQEGEKWGILLAKEGTICVVMRAPVSNDTPSLQVGDLILSATNEHGEKALIPMNGKFASHGWFTDTTALFKKSLVMHLEIRSASQKRSMLGK